MNFPLGRRPEGYLYASNSQDRQLSVNVPGTTGSAALQFYKARQENQLVKHAKYLADPRTTATTPPATSLRSRSHRQPERSGQCEYPYSSTQGRLCANDEAGDLFDDGKRTYRWDAQSHLGDFIDKAPRRTGLRRPATPDSGQVPLEAPLARPATPSVVNHLPEAQRQ